MIVGNLYKNTDHFLWTLAGQQKDHTYWVEISNFLCVEKRPYKAIGGWWVIFLAPNGRLIEAGYSDNVLEELFKEIEL